MLQAVTTSMVWNLIPKKYGTCHMKSKPVSYWQSHTMLWVTGSNKILSSKESGHFPTKNLTVDMADFPEHKCSLVTSPIIIGNFK